MTWLKILEFATYNTVLLSFNLGTTGGHDTTKRGLHNDQIDCSLVTERSHERPLHSDADLKHALNQGNHATQGISFDLKKLNDPSVMSAFKALVSGKFAPLSMLVDGHVELDPMVTGFKVLAKA